MSPNIGSFKKEGLACIKCGFKNHEHSAAFCQNCGSQLEGNYCTNKDCHRCLEHDPGKETEPNLLLTSGIVLACPNDALYCPDCGEKTTFHLRRILNPPYQEE